MGARRRHLSRIPAKRQSLDEGGKRLADHFQSRGRNHESQDLSPLLLTKMLYNRDTETGLACNLQHVEAPTVEGFCFVEHHCRIPEDLCFPKWKSAKTAQARNWVEHKNANGSQCVFSPIPKHFFVSLCAVVHAAEHAPISWQSARCFHSPREQQPSDTSW